MIFYPKKFGFWIHSIDEYIFKGKGVEFKNLENLKTILVNEWEEAPRAYLGAVWLGVRQPLGPDVHPSCSTLNWRTKNNKFTVGSAMLKQIIMIIIIMSEKNWSNKLIIHADDYTCAVTRGFFIFLILKLDLHQSTTRSFPKKWIQINNWMTQIFHLVKMTGQVRRVGNHIPPRTGN